MFLGVLAIAAGVIAVDSAMPRKQLDSISAVYFGLIVGLFLSYVAGLALTPLFPSLETAGPQILKTRAAVQLVLSAVLCYVCISLLMQTRNDFRFIIPYVEFSKEVKGRRPYILDTSVVIDGRIADVVETNVLDSQLVMPRFVITELQGIADSSDRLRRSRGRRGLDILNRLRNNPEVDMQIFDRDLPEFANQPVDLRLVTLAKKLTLYSGVSVLTINGGIQKTWISYSMPEFLRVSDSMDILDKAALLAPLLENGLAVILPDFIIEYEDTVSEYMAEIGKSVHLKDDIFPVYDSEKALQKANPYYERLLFEDIYLPYFRDISLETLVKLRTEETDAFLKFQYNLESIYNELAITDSESKIKELLKRTDYEVRTLNGEFEKIKRLRALQVFNVGLFAISILALVGGGSEFLKLLSGAVGAQTFGTAVHDWSEYQEDLRQFKSKDFYIAWKVSQFSHSQ